MVDDPRLTCFQPRSVPTRPTLLAAGRAALSDRYGVRVGRPAFNYYRDGRDRAAPHSDRALRDLVPGSGDLLVMGGRTQMDWEHAVPKVKYSGPRVSISGRWSTRRARA